MPRGARPGERRGGRVKGQPNKTTVERMRRAELDVAAARARGEKLGKEVLRDYMLIFQERAERYRKPPHADEAKFEKYAQLAVDCARWLAPYESPTFRSIAVMPAPPEGERVKRFTLRVFESGRPLLDVTPPRAPALRESVPSTGRSAHGNGADDSDDGDDAA
jgi:hypothetical protein